MRRKLPLHTKIIIGLVLGVLWALVTGYLGWSQFTLNWIAPWGTIFINILKLIAVPLVLFSVIAGIGSLGDVGSIGRIGFRTLMLYLTTTVIAITIGLSLVNVVKPGDFAGNEQRLVNRIQYELWANQNPSVEIVDGLSYASDPANARYLESAREALQEGEANASVQKYIETAESTAERGPLSFMVEMVPDNFFFSLTNSMMLQIIFFAIFFGLTMITLPGIKTAAMLGFINSGNEIFIRMVEIVMGVAPYFVFALMAGTMAELAGDSPAAMLEIFKALGVYSLVVVGGLLILMLGIYPSWIALRISRRSGMTFGKSYKYFMKGIRPAQLLAFSTSSSAATLPVTMECVSDNIGVGEEVSSFVLPIGATVNMDGTSLYQAVAVIFLAQFHMIDLTLAQQATIVLTATLASIGSAAVPSAGLIMLILVLSSVGLNPAWIAIIFPIDRILDMCRTVINVTGDAAVSTIVAQMENKFELIPDPVIESNN